MKTRNWSWWRLFTKIKPLLSIARQDEELAQKQEEIRRLKVDMESSTAQVTETNQKLQQVQVERDTLKEHLAHSNEVLAESDEVSSLLSNSGKNFFHCRVFNEHKLGSKNWNICYKSWNNVYKILPININAGKVTANSSIKSCAMPPNSKESTLFRALIDSFSDWKRKNAVAKNYNWNAVT